MLLASIRIPLVAMAALLTALGTPARAAVAACDGSWSVVAAPTLPSGLDLREVAVLASGEAWTLSPSFFEERTVVGHRQGGRWHTEELEGKRLIAIAARPGSVWAVGSHGEGDQGDLAKPLVLRNDGSGWRQVTLPAAAQRAKLTSVAMTSARNVWVSGQQQDRDGRGLVLHFDGSSWITFLLTQNSSPQAVDTLSATNTWIVGLTATPQGNRPASWHWTGGSWRQELLAGDYGEGAGFHAVTALQDGTVWAAGSWSLGNCCNEVGIAARHTAQGWRDVKAFAGLADAHLYDVQVGRNEALPTLFGFSYIGDGSGGYDTPVLTSRVNGTWVRQDVVGLVQPPPPPGADGELFAADGDGRGGTWAAGRLNGKPLLLHRCLPPPAHRPFGADT